MRFTTIGGLFRRWCPDSLRSRIGGIYCLLFLFTRRFMDLGQLWLSMDIPRCWDGVPRRTAWGCDMRLDADHIAAIATSRANYAGRQASCWGWILVLARTFHDRARRRCGHRRHGVNAAESDSLQLGLWEA